MASKNDTCEPVIATKLFKPERYHSKAPGSKKLILCMHWSVVSVWTQSGTTTVAVIALMFVIRFTILEKPSITINKVQYPTWSLHLFTTPHCHYDPATNLLKSTYNGQVKRCVYRYFRKRTRLQWATFCHRLMGRREKASVSLPASQWHKQMRTSSPSICPSDTCPWWCRQCGKGGGAWWSRMTCRLKREMKIWAAPWCCGLSLWSL